MRRIQWSAVILCSLAIVVAACGSSSKSSTSTTTSGPTQTSSATVTTAPAPSPGGAAVTIVSGGSGFMFTTSPVKAGATVTVKNDTAAQHTVSADTTAGGFDVTVDPGKTTTLTGPSKPGSYKFHCNIHTYMMGTLTVT
jgi:plastocyanin